MCFVSLSSLDLSHLTSSIPGLQEFPLVCLPYNDGYENYRPPKSLLLTCYSGLTFGFQYDKVVPAIVSCTSWQICKLHFVTSNICFVPLCWTEPGTELTWMFGTKLLCGRHGGLMVSVFVSRSSGLGCGDIVLCSWARHFTLAVPLSTQVYKWVLANLMLGVTLLWTSIPSMGE